MPQVIQIRPKGIYVNIEFGLDELQKLVEVCDHIEVKINKNDARELAMADFFNGTFYTLIKKVVEDLK